MNGGVLIKRHRRGTRTDIITHPLCTLLEKHKLFVKHVQRGWRENDTVFCLQ